MTKPALSRGDASTAGVVGGSRVYMVEDFTDWSDNAVRAEKAGTVAVNSRAVFQ